MEENSDNDSGNKNDNINLYFSSNSSHETKKIIEMEENNNKDVLIPNVETEITPEEENEKKNAFITTIPGKHDKNHYRDLNYDINQKIKIYFVKSLLNFLNALFKKITKEKDYLKKIKFDEYNKINEEINRNFVQMTVKELFKKNISQRYKLDKDYNKEQIKLFYEKYNNHKESNLVINILEKTIGEMFKSYCDNNGEYKTAKFWIENDLETIRKKSNLQNDDEYIKNIRRNAHNFLSKYCEQDKKEKEKD